MKDQNYITFIDGIDTIIKFFSKNFNELPFSDQIAIALYDGFLQGNKYKFSTTRILFEADELKEIAYKIDEVHSTCSMNFTYKDGTEFKNTIYMCLFHLLLAANDSINEVLENIEEIEDETI